MNIHDLKPRLHDCAVIFATPRRGGDYSPETLAEHVQCSVTALPQDRLSQVEGPRPNVTFQPSFMLAVLTYFYSKQVYSSLEIRRCLRRDESLHGLCEGKYPDCSWIARFRFLNMNTIQECLAKALLFLARQKKAEGHITRFNENFAAGEAARRIVMAQYTDSLEQNEQSWQEFLEEPFTNA